MSTSAKSARSKKELFKIDRDVVFQLLKSKGNLEAVSGFVDDVEFMLGLAKCLVALAPDAILHKELEKIRGNADVLLKSLQRNHFDLNFDLKHNIFRYDLQMVNLVVESRILLNREKGSLNTTKENSLVRRSMYIDYSGPLIDSLHELLDAVNYAKKRVYVPSGTSPNGNPEYVRKRVLADHFVRYYYRRFNRYPPVTAGGPAIQVFDIFISATGMSVKSHLYYIRNAINACKRHSLHISDDVNLSNT